MVKKDLTKKKVTVSKRKERRAKRRMRKSNEQSLELKNYLLEPPPEL